MFPSTKKCLEIETKGSYSTTVIGILIATVTIAIGLSMFGVWADAFDGSQNDDFDLPYIPENNPLKDLNSKETSEMKVSEGVENLDEASLVISDELVPERGCLGCFDTVPGTLKVVEEVLPEGPLPLCIDNEWLSQYHIVVESVGGYAPVWGEVYLDQNKADDCYQGIIKAHFEARPVDDCPCTVLYYVTFYVEEPICLDSNHLPEGFDQSVTLDKWVCGSYFSVWEGCHLPEQQFVVILAHKAMN
jgi:hypothetical protein